MASSEFCTEFLRVYYNRLFPYAEMARWLAYGHDRKLPGSDVTYFQRREFSFTLEHDIYVRYQSFKDAADMAAVVREKCPHKIDIGAVYNVDPSKRASFQTSTSEGAFAPVERELVFDVDMSDYDDIRTCCTGASVCTKCWPLMTVAIKVVDAALREDFGFDHILWVFSGRRGVHCWVCDQRARRLSNEQRSAIAEYFRVFKGSEVNSAGSTFHAAALHPSLSRAYEILRHYFEAVLLPEQQLLIDPNTLAAILAMIPDEGVRDRLEAEWQGSSGGSASDNAKRWQQLEATLRDAAKKNTALRRTVEEIVFKHCYPRLDLEVSKHMNHLLKAPFCVHPKTGRVCVPMDPNTCEEFDPTQTPTLSQLLQELNDPVSESLPSNGTASAAPTVAASDVTANGAGHTQQPAEAGAKGHPTTSLTPFVQFFQTTFLTPLCNAAKEDLQVAHKQQRAQNVQASGSLFSW